MNSKSQHADINKRALLEVNRAASAFQRSLELFNKAIELWLLTEFNDIAYTQNSRAADFAGESLVLEAERFYLAAFGPLPNLQRKLIAS